MKENIISALDIGASTVRCLIGSRQEKNQINIHGLGVVNHNYIKRGVVVDLKGLSDVISKAVYEAESQSEKKVHSVYINISGTHAEGINVHGEMVISDRDREITRFDADRVTSNAKAINLPYDREIAHSIHYGYIVDGEKGIRAPAGMFGLKLEADLYLITSKTTLIENLKKAVRQAGIGIAGVAVSALASSLAVLSEHEKQIGVVLLDIGADLTEVSIYTEGLLRYIKIIPFGGKDVTEQTSKAFRLPAYAAERIKIENGSIDAKYNRSDKIIYEIESRKRVIYKKELQSVLKNSYKELFGYIKDALSESKMLLDASCGIVIVGQSGVCEGLVEAIEMELKVPARLGHMIGLGFCPQHLPSHIYATAVGLLRYGLNDLERRHSFLRRGAKGGISFIINYLRTLCREYF